MTDEVLKRRLIGAAVVLLGAWVVTWFLPDPGARPQAEEGVQLVTLPVEDPAAPPTLPEAVETPAPPVIAAPEAVAEAASEPTPEVSVEPEPEPEPDPEPIPKPAPGPSPPPKSEPKPKAAGPALTLDSKLGKVPAPATAPAAPGPSPAPPRAAPAAPREKTWTVQVGSFSNIDNARELQAKLKAAGIDSILSPAETDKGTLYRVRAGSRLDRDAAKALQQKVQQLGHPQATLSEE